MGQERYDLSYLFTAWTVGVIGFVAEFGATAVSDSSGWTADSDRWLISNWILSLYTSAVSNVSEEIIPTCILLYIILNMKTWLNIKFNKN